MDLITIIIPVYNAENTLERCLNSIAAQTYRDLQVILIDDGSKDSGAELCRAFCSRDSRFEYVYQKNAGVSAARNAGLGLARGKYIAFCDSDDWVDADYIEKLHTALTGASADVAICGFACHDGSRELSRVTPPAAVMDRTGLASRFWQLQEDFLLSSVWNKLYARSVITCPFNETMSCGEDLHFNMRNLIGAERAAFTGTAGYYYYKPPAAGVRYTKNTADQCLVYSDSVRDFLASALPEESFVKEYENFLCCNMCRDVCTISASNSFAASRAMIKDFLAKPEFRRVLEHKAWAGSGKKYAIVGNLLRRRLVTPIIAASKLLK